MGLAMSIGWLVAVYTGHPWLWEKLIELGTIAVAGTASDTAIEVLEL
jgi:hypothetical protein